jgi:hypothetical protein
MKPAAEEPAAEQEEPAAEEPAAEQEEPAAEQEEPAAEAPNNSIDESHPPARPPFLSSIQQRFRPQHDDSDDDSEDPNLGTK